MLFPFSWFIMLIQCTSHWDIISGQVNNKGRPLLEINKTGGLSKYHLFCWKPLDRSHSKQLEYSSREVWTASQLKFCNKSPYANRHSEKTMNLPYSMGSWHIINGFDSIGSILIPLLVTIKPSNLLEVAPKMHFFGLSFNWYLCQSISSPI